MNIRIILQYSKNYFRMFEKNCYRYFYRFPKKIQSFIKKIAISRKYFRTHIEYFSNI